MYSGSRKSWYSFSFCGLTKKILFSEKNIRILRLKREKLKKHRYFFLQFCLCVCLKMFFFMNTRVFQTPIFCSEKTQNPIHNSKLQLYWQVNAISSHSLDFFSEQFRFFFGTNHLYFFERAVCILKECIFIALLNQRGYTKWQWKTKGKGRDQSPP